MCDPRLFLGLNQRGTNALRIECGTPQIGGIPTKTSPKQARFHNATPQKTWLLTITGPNENKPSKQREKVKLYM